MGTGATAGIIAGRPPWRREAWLEGLLKAVVGLALGLGLYWLARRFLAAPMPFGLLGAPEGTAWTDLPLLYAPAVGALYGGLVELDNTPGGRAGSAAKTATRPTAPKAPPPPPAPKAPPRPAPPKAPPHPRTGEG
jgi:hypothetical protein